MTPAPVETYCDVEVAALVVASVLIAASMMTVLVLAAVLPQVSVVT